MASNEHPSQINGITGRTTVTILSRSWDFDPWAAGYRAVLKHAEALRRLAS